MYQTEFDITSVTIIILTYKRIELLKRNLVSILDSNTQGLSVIIKVILNGDDLESKEYLASIADNVEVVLLDEALEVGEARNMGLKDISSEYILFLDDDTYIDENYFNKSLKHIEQYSSDVFGGPDRTGEYASVFQRASGELLKSYFVTGPTRLRHDAVGVTKVASEVSLILCNLWIKTKILKSYKFPKEYIRGEENVLIQSISDDGFKIYYVPELFVYHERKTLVTKIIRATFFSGMYRFIGFRDNPNTLHLVFFVPMLSIVSGLLLMLIGNYMALGMLSLLYVVLIFYVATISFKNTRSLKVFVVSIYLIPVYHISYGLGSMLSIFKWRKNEN